MALGPEGPGVQMGAVSARLIGTAFHRTWPDMRALVAAGAGAGIAVAFNAPIAGAIFVLEALVRRFDMRMAIAGLGASSSAILISRLLLGDAPELHVTISGHLATATGPLPYAAAATWPLYLALGALAGAAAVLYNWLIIRALTVSDRLVRWPVEAKAAVVGAIIGAIGWFAPELIGPGRQHLTACPGRERPLAARYRLHSSYGFSWARPPMPRARQADLFAPLLVLGALIGFLLGSLFHQVFPGTYDRAPGICCGWHGGVLYGGGPHASNRNRACDRNDCCIHDPVAVAGGVFRRDVARKCDRQSSYLCFATRATHE